MRAIMPLCLHIFFQNMSAPSVLQGTSGTRLASVGCSVTSYFRERSGPRRGRLYSHSFIRVSHVAFQVRSLQSLAFIGSCLAYLGLMIFITFADATYRVEVLYLSHAASSISLSTDDLL